MRCLETRETPEGYRRRRYESATGFRWTTIEVPIEVWRRVNTVGRQRNRAAQAERAIERERKAHQLRLLVANGSSVADAAIALQIPLSTARRWAQAKGK